MTIIDPELVIQDGLLKSLPERLLKRPLKRPLKDCLKDCLKGMARLHKGLIILGTIYCDKGESCPLRH